MFKFATACTRLLHKPRPRVQTDLHRTLWRFSPEYLQPCCDPEALNVDNSATQRQRKGNEKHAAARDGRPARSLKVLIKDHNRLKYRL